MVKRVVKPMVKRVVKRLVQLVIYPSELGFFSKKQLLAMPDGFSGLWSY